MIYKFLILILLVELLVFLQICNIGIYDLEIAYDKNKNNYNSLNDNVTLVTAYYKIKSKHSFEQYLSWMQNVLNINKSLIIFGDKSTINEIYK